MTKNIEPDITRHNDTLCPACGYVFNAAGTIDGRPGQAVPGDICGCLACGQSLIYEEHMQVRKLTKEEYEALDALCKRDLAKIKAFAQTGWYRG